MAKSGYWGTDVQIGDDGPDVYIFDGRVRLHISPETLEMTPDEAKHLARLLIEAAEIA